MANLLPHLALVVLTVSMLGCAPVSSPALPAEGVDADIPLPAPSVDGSVLLEEALVQRRSVREFSTERLALEDLGQLLWAAQGTTDERGFRTAPSAGALYPLEVYVATAEGVYHYEPHGHLLQGVVPNDVRPALHEAALKQEAIRLAPAVFIVTAVYERTTQKYGTGRGPRYVHLEAGHAAQNLLLMATALELGAVPIGAFDDGAVQRVLGLPEDHEPLYLIPVGQPTDAGR